MSIYVMLTNRCNMHCAHCGFACTNRGKDMSELVFRRVLAFCIRNRIGMTLGGGEPTIHPQFWKWLTYARKRFAPLFEELEGGTIGLVTNGSNTEMSLKLAEMARVGKIWAAVSKDRYHDEIDPKVFKAFERPKLDRYSSHYWGLSQDELIKEERRLERDRRDIRTVGVVRPAGRAKSWGDPRFGTWCCGIHVDPDGKMWECSCRKVLICDFSKTAGRRVNLDAVLGEDWYNYSCTKERMTAAKLEAEREAEAKKQEAEEELMRNFKLEGELVKAS